MVEYSIIIDTDRCFACYGCEVACKQEHSLPVGPRWIRVKTAGPVEIGKKLHMKFFPMTCQHCYKPDCMDACPVSAITKRPDGIVLINPEICTGCKACIQACPFGAPQFNPEKGVVEKCDLCVDRVEKGLQPACVQSCWGRAIHFGDINELSDLKRDRHVQRLLKK